MRAARATSFFVNPLGASLQKSILFICFFFLLVSYFDVPGFSSRHTVNLSPSQSCNDVMCLARHSTLPLLSFAPLSESVSACLRACVLASTHECEKRTVRFREKSRGAEAAGESVVSLCSAIGVFVFSSRRCDVSPCFFCFFRSVSAFLSALVCEWRVFRSVHASFVCACARARFSVRSRKNM